MLSDEEAWLEIAILKATRVKKLLGGASGLAVAVLELFYNTEHDALAAGVFSAAAWGPQHPHPSQTQKCTGGRSGLTCVVWMQGTCGGETLPQMLERRQWFDRQGNRRYRCSLPHLHGPCSI